MGENVQSDTGLQISTCVDRDRETTIVDNDQSKPNEDSPNSTSLTTSVPVSSSSRTGALRVLFLSSDTGGGHRASAEALSATVRRLYPGSTCEVWDVMSEHGTPPYDAIVPSYKYLSSHPRQWGATYAFTDNRFCELVHELYLKVTLFEKRIQRVLLEKRPDVVVSVHPLMNHAPAVCCRRIGRETGVHLPCVTVVTDLGGCHRLWFSPETERTFVASDAIYERGLRTRQVEPERLVRTGLPIRHNFAVQARALHGDRFSERGKMHCRAVRRSLGLHVGLADRVGDPTHTEEKKEKGDVIDDDNNDVNHSVILVMGGGEGVGSLSDICDALYLELTSSTESQKEKEDYITSVGSHRKRNVVTVLVVCGRNDALKQRLEQQDWEEMKRRRRKRQALLRHLPFLKAAEVDAKDEDAAEVRIIPLGFVTNMAEYMVAADLLITKAGPGTIAEATAVGLPLLLSGCLPGQEEGNVSYVVDVHQCGKIETHPTRLACTAREWIQDVDLRQNMSRRAVAASCPDAAEHICRSIGESTLRWKETRVNSAN